MRRPRVYRAASARRHYLFSEQATVYDLTFAIQEKLKKDLAALPAEALLNRSAQEVSAEIVGRYTLNTPTIDRGNISELPPEETQIEVPQITQNRAFLRPRPSLRPGDRLQHKDSVYRGPEPVPLPHLRLRSAHRG
jgi:hypothetical protein